MLMSLPDQYGSLIEDSASISVVAIEGKEYRQLFDKVADALFEVVAKYCRGTSTVEEKVELEETEDTPK